jgi:hypothetical protein
MLYNESKQNILALLGNANKEKKSFLFVVVACLNLTYELSYYLTLRLVSPLNNPQNSEMNFCETMNLKC